MVECGHDRECCQYQSHCSTDRAAELGQTGDSSECRQSGAAAATQSRRL